MEGIRQAHERLLRDPGFQFRFPTPAEPPPGVPGFVVPAEAFWVVFAIVAAVLLAVAVQALLSRRLPGVSPGPAPDADGAPAPAAVPVSAAVLADADALAQAGRYGDAVHALLLRGVGVLQARFRGALTPAHTSRDIAALPVLPPAAAQAFATIGAHAERAVFARRPLARQDWEECRTLYAALLASRRGEP